MHDKRRKTTHATKFARRKSGSIFSQIFGIFILTFSFFYWSNFHYIFECHQESLMELYVLDDGLVSLDNRRVEQKIYGKKTT